jgi:recombination protein RecA
MADYESLASIISAIQKKYGDDVLIKGSDIKEEVPRITTGILAYDLMLGGGWPLNQWSEIIGEESSGKTALAYKTIAANQAINPEFVAMWIAAEAYVPQYARAIGVDLERLLVVETNIMEHVYDLVIKALDNRAVDMIVIDSLPSLVPGDESEKMMEEFTVGLGARLTGKFFRKSSKAQRRSLINEDRPCTGLVINQWREKIGVMWGDNRTTPGGKAKNFHYFTRVEVKRDEWLKEKDETIGQTIKARTIKNKTYRPQQTAVVDFYFTSAGGFRLGAFDVIKDVVNIGIAVGLITRSGPYYSYGSQKWQGKDALVLAIREDLDLQQKLKKEAFDHFNLQVPTQ